ncbi:MAG: hypothetical protein QXE32_02335 [Sulfolobales archaeon]
MKVVYDEFNNAEEAYARLSLGGYSYDVFNLGIEVMYKALKANLLEKLDHRKIPNIKYRSVDHGITQDQISRGNRSKRLWNSIYVGYD